MNSAEVQTFIDEMESIGDEWTAEQVKDCYGSMSLDEALLSRKTEVDEFLTSIGKAAVYLENNKS